MKIQFKRYPFTKILGWSNSRYELFTRCRRAYFFQYYSKFVPDVSFAKVNQLKNLTTVPMEVGNVIHHIVETFLKRLQKSDANIDEERFIQYGLKLCDEIFDKKNFLEEHYGYVASVNRDGAKEKIDKALTNFMKSPLYSWIFMKAILNKEHWVIEPEGFGETRIDGLKAYCKMDFLFPVDGEIHILDWKSGKQDVEKHTMQLLGYAVATQVNNPKVEGNKIYPRIVYINPDVSEFEVKITDEMLEQFTQTVREQSEEMQSYCTNIEENIPNSIEHFPTTEQDGICRNCFYQEICSKHINKMEEIPF